MKPIDAIALVLSLCATATPVSATVVVETVTVGNPGNADDTHYAGYGGVGYVYRIGKYEITAAQYTDFLNAVAATDTYDLYHEGMWSYPTGCKIERTGSPGSYIYSVAGDRANRPVNVISWGDAARFCNWLHNGQLTGPQGPGTTEDGSYFLNGASTDAGLLSVARQPDATWVIPQQDEWYKAAYHKNDGVTGNYFDYETSSDIRPSNDLITPDPGNNANFWDHVAADYTIGGPYWRTEVGEFENSGSPYGTFDQAGNVYEWIEDKVRDDARGWRGGEYGSSGSLGAASSAFYVGGLSPTTERPGVGFRVAEVPPFSTAPADAQQVNISATASTYRVGVGSGPLPEAASLRVRWGMSPSYDQELIDTDLMSNPVFTLDSLSPLTEYYFEAMCVGVSGRVYETGPHSFLTSCDAANVSDCQSEIHVEVVGNGYHNFDGMWRIPVVSVPAPGSTVDVTMFNATIDVIVNGTIAQSPGDAVGVPRLTQTIDDLNQDWLFLFGCDFLLPGRRLFQFDYKQELPPAGTFSGVSRHTSRQVTIPLSIWETCGDPAASEPAEREPDRSYFVGDATLDLLVDASGDSVAPGGDVEFFATAVSTGNDPVFLNSVAIHLSEDTWDPNLAIVDPLPFVTDFPLVLPASGDPNDTAYGAILRVSIEPNTPIGSYLGYLQVLGGADEQAVDELANAFFSVEVVAPTTPMILEHPQAQDVPWNGPVTVAVTATDTTSLTYQWRHNGVDVNGANGAALTIGALTPEVAGSYDVVVSNAITSTVSESALVSGYLFHGDLNCDGLLNYGDIDPFVLALTDPDGYANAHADCSRDRADCNGDALVNYGDIDPFVDLLTG